MSAAAEYVLPLRWHDDAALPELTAYLRDLTARIDVTVVDGSPPALFARHAEVWAGMLRHVPVDASTSPGAVAASVRPVNGKVLGVLTGVHAARHERVVIADDDVRYGERELAAVVDALAEADLVVPQNHFAPLPWHARWDTARTLLNRAVGADYPGTYGVRRSSVLAAGGYDAGVLFENLELERTIRAVGGTVRVRRDLLVARRPPSASHFRRQRLRQAYDSWAQPWRFAIELAALPVAVLLRRRPAGIGAIVLALVVMAEIGRRRAGGTRVWPATSALWAPVWAAERAVTSWCAVALRLVGGVPYAGSRLARAATSQRRLRRRLAQPNSAVVAETPCGSGTT
ncbi:glycosyltransferase [Microbacterium sp. NPDC091313]